LNVTNGINAGSANIAAGLAASGITASTAAITGHDASGFGLNVTNGINAGSANIAAGLAASGITASTEALTGRDNLGYSLTLSSGINMPAGTVNANVVNANLFVGSGAGLTNLPATAVSSLLASTNTWSADQTYLNPVAYLSPVTLSGSTLTVTGQDASGFGLNVAYGINAGSANIAAGLTAQTATLTGQNGSGYSLALSSGINMPAGTVNANVVNANLFVGSGAGLTNLPATAVSSLLASTNTWSADQTYLNPVAYLSPVTLSGSTLTVTGQDASGFGLNVTNGINAGSANLAAGLTALTATLTGQNSGYSLTLSSGINMPAGTVNANVVNANLFVGSGAGLTNLPASAVSSLLASTNTWTADQTYLNPVAYLSPVTLSGSTLTVTGVDASGFGLNVTNGINAGSANLAAGLAASGITASTEALTGRDNLGYSLTLSSGINMPAGTVNANVVNANLFVGSGAGLTNLPASAVSSLLASTNTWTADQTYLNPVAYLSPVTLSGSTLTVTGQDASGFGLNVAYGINAGSANLAAGLTALTATLTGQNSGYSLTLSSGINMPNGTVNANVVNANLFVGNGAGLTNLPASAVSSLLASTNTWTADQTYLNPVAYLSPVTLSGSTLTVTGADTSGFGLNVTNGITAGSANLAAGLTALTATITGQNGSGYSLALSSGISMPNGTVNANVVNANLFVGSGAGLTNLPASAVSSLLASTNTWSAQQTFANEVTVSSGLYVTAPSTFTGTVNAAAFMGDGAGLTNIKATAVSALMTSTNTWTAQQTFGNEVTVSSGLYVTAPSTFTGTVNAAAFIGNGAGLTDIAISPSELSSLLSSTNTWSANQTYLNPVTIVSTLTVQGNAFSVGGSTFAVKAGSVGIGTASPKYALDVHGDVNISTTSATTAYRINGYQVMVATDTAANDPRYWATYAP
jgi:hypothetical protein